MGSVDPKHLSVACPYCMAPIGTHCARIRDGRPAGTVHLARVYMAHGLPITAQSMRGTVAVQD